MKVLSPCGSARLSTTTRCAFVEELASTRYKLRNNRGTFYFLTCGPRRRPPTMVEGHQCHRVGHAHRRLLLGKRFTASSPNGRFVEGAAAISGKLLSRIEVHGKNLFYFFGGSDTTCQHTPAAAPLLHQVDEDPLQPGVIDVHDNAKLPQPIANATGAAAAAPRTPGRRGRTAPASPAVQTASASAASPMRPLLASAGRTAVTLCGNSGSASVLSPHTPGAPAAAASAVSSAVLGFQSADAAAATKSDDVVVVHIHFGMSGAFRTSSLPGPEPTPTTRLRLVHESTALVAHLSAMTVAHGGIDLYQDKVSKLGPDPLRPRDDADRFWARVQGSKKPIGLLLMDQTAIAGVGNIYRAEILYKSGLHPEQPGYTVDRANFEVLWGHCVDLLQRGFRSGSILTVDPEDARVLGQPWTRRYIYNQSRCGRCKGPVKVWDMATRKVYCCVTCQPLRLTAGATPGLPTPTKDMSDVSPAAAAAATAADLEVVDLVSRDMDDAAAAAAQLLHPSRRKSMASARVSQEFVSHCAPDEPSTKQPSKLTCQQLRDHLRALNLDTRGNKPQLVARLEAAQVWMTGSGPPQPCVNADAAAEGDHEPQHDSDSGDELDRAEAALAARLSVSAHNTPDCKQLPHSSAMPKSGVIPGSRRSKRPGKATASGTGKVPAAAEDGIASTRAAEVEKVAAGENKAVEHVALQADDWTDQLMFGKHEEQQHHPAKVAADSGLNAAIATPPASRSKRVRRI